MKYTHCLPINLYIESLCSAQRHVVGSVPLISAESSKTLRYNFPQLGIDGNISTNAKFIADEESFWYQVHFDDIYCVDQVMTLDAEVYSHAWTCTENGCGAPCQGLMCKYVDVTVLNEDSEHVSSKQPNNCKTVSSQEMPANCGNGAKISISLEDAKTLEYAFFEVSLVFLCKTLFFSLCVHASPCFRNQNKENS